MPTKNAISITVSRFSLVFKLLVYLLLVALIISAISFSLLNTTLKNIWTQIEELDLINSGKNLLLSGINGTSLEVQEQLYNEFSEGLESFKDICIDNMTNITWSIVLLFFMFFLFDFFFTVSNYTVTSIVKSFMTSNTEYSFSSTFVAKIGISFRYALLQIAIVIPFYLIGFALALGLGLLVAKLSPVLGFAIALVIILLTFSVKRGLLFAWVPSMVTDSRGVIEGLKDTFRVKMRATIDAIGAYFIFFLVLMVVTCTSALFTFGVGAILSIAFGIVYAQVFDLVMFFNQQGYKYYVDEQNIVDSSRKYRTVEEEKKY